jgi:hypothetical protein
MPYIPSTLKIFHSNNKTRYTIEDEDEKPKKIECFSGFPTDAANGASHKTAIRWASDSGLSPGSYGSTDLKNTPVPSVQIVGLSYRGRGGRAWKVIDRGFLFDLREGVLLELLTKADGTFKNGVLTGPFIWVSDGGLNLVRAGSKRHEEAALGKPPKNTVSEPEQGNVFELKKNKYVTKVSPASQKEEEWLYTSTVPTDLGGLFLTNALLDGTLKTPTKRPTLPEGSLVGTIKPNLDELLVILLQKILAETVEWTTGSYMTFKNMMYRLRYKSPIPYGYNLITFVQSIVEMQYCVFNEMNGLDPDEVCRLYCNVIRNNSYYTSGVGYTRNFTHMEPFRIYAGNCNDHEKLLRSGFQEVASNPNPACQACCSIFANTALSSKVINTQHPQHLVDCVFSSAEAVMSTADLLAPGMIQKYGLLQEHFEPIRPPAIVSDTTSRYIDMKSIIAKRAPTSTGKLIPSFSKFQY